jgi:hypothetical protein
MSSSASSTVPAKSTSLGARLMNVLVTPGAVFHEVIAAPSTAINWRVPTLLLCLAGIIWTQFALRPKSALGVLAIERTGVDTQMFAGVWPIISSLTLCLGTFLGMLWSAFVLWSIGRVCLKVRFSFLKTIEVVGLAGMILLLGTVMTSLLVMVSGDGTVRPALSLFAGKTGAGEPLRLVLEAFNFFHVWSATVLAIGLSALSGVSFKEAAFWVFGYWFVARIALIVLA